MVPKKKKTYRSGYKPNEDHWNDLKRPSFKTPHEESGVMVQKVQAALKDEFPGDGGEDGVCEGLGIVNVALHTI